MSTKTWEEILATAAGEYKYPSSETALLLAAAILDFEVALRAGGKLPASWRTLGVHLAGYERWERESMAGMTAATEYTEEQRQAHAAGWSRRRPCSMSARCEHLECDRCLDNETVLPGRPMPRHRCRKKEDLEA